MLFVRAASEAIRERLGAARKAARSALTMPRGTASAVMRTAEGFANLAARGPSAPPTFLNREIGRDRRVGFVSAELEALKRRPRRERRHRQRRDPVDRRRRVAAAVRAPRASRVPEQLVALVPMSIRRPDEHLELGNRIATLIVALPLSERGSRRGASSASTRRPPG